MSLRRSLLHALVLLILVGLCLPETAWVFAQSKARETWDVTKARGTTREIDFDTTEGTWMSLNLSQGLLANWAIRHVVLRIAPHYQRHHHSVHWLHRRVFQKS